MSMENITFWLHYDKAFGHGLGYLYGEKVIEVLIDKKIFFVFEIVEILIDYGCNEFNILLWYLGMGMNCDRKLLDSVKGLKNDEKLDIYVEHVNKIQILRLIITRKLHVVVVHP